MNILGSDQLRRTNIKNFFFYATLLIHISTTFLIWDFFKQLQCQYYSMFTSLDFREISWEKKTWWELHKDVACYFEQIMEAASNKTAIVRPLDSHLTKQPSKTNKISWIRLETLGRAYKWRSTPTREHTRVSWPAKTFIHSSARCGHWILSRRLTKSDYR